MRYYIIEHQTRPDGVVNTSETGRSSFAAGLSFFHERCSKMSVTELYTKVSILMVDEALNEVPGCKVTYTLPLAEQ